MIFKNSGRNDRDPEFDFGIDYRSFFNYMLAGLPGWRRAFVDGFFSKCFEIIEKHFGSKILFTSPPDLNGINPDFWHLFHYANALKRAGIISSLRRTPNYPDEPQLFRYRVEIKGEPDPAVGGMGHSIFSEEKAIASALGETIERYCFRNYVPPQSQIRVASYDDFGPEEALDPSSFAGISDSVRDKYPSGRFRLPSSTEKFHWVKGRGLVRRGNVWIPLQLITINQELESRINQLKEPLIRRPVSTGAAAGTSLEEALYRGVCEIIERDAYMITYLNRLSPPRLNPNDFPNSDVRNAQDKLKRYRLTLKLFRLPSDIPCHVVMSVILPDTEDSPYFTLGFKADLDLPTAMLGAVSESLNGRVGTRFLLEKLDRATVPNVTEVEKIGQFERVYIWQTQPELLPQIRFLWQGVTMASKDIPLYPAATLDYHDKLEFLLAYFRQENLKVAYVENTAPALRGIAAGPWKLRSVFVLIPELQPMHLHEKIPYVAGKRIKSVPRKLGYLVDDSINILPQPFP